MANGPLSVVLALLLPVMASAAEEVSFKQQLAPILARRCLGCHNNRKAEGRYAVHTFEQLLTAGDSGTPPIVPGKPDESYLFQKLIETDASLRMPQEDEPLGPDQIALFRAWIDQGARFDGPTPSDRIVTLLPARQHPRPPETYRRAVPVFALRFSPDGQSLFTAGVHEVLVWDVASGALARRIADMPQRIHALRITPDGTSLAVAGGAPGEYGEIRLVNLADQTIRTLPAWEDVILDVAFDRQGATLVACGADNSLRAYEVASARELWRNQQHVDWVTAVDVTDYEFAEELVANADVAHADATSRFEFNQYEIASGVHPQQHWSFPDGHFIVRKANWELESIGDQTVSLTRITITGIGKTYQEQRERMTGPVEQEHSDVILALHALHRDWGARDRGATSLATPFVVTASRDRTAKVFGLRAGQLFTTYKGHRREYGPLAGMHRVHGIQAEPGTRRVWSGGEGRHLHGWNPLTVRDEDGTAADMEERFAKEYSIDLLRHDLPDPVFALLRSGSQLFAATAGGQARSFPISGPLAQFDLNQPAPSHAYLGLQDQLYALDAHAGTGRVAAAGLRGEVAIWSQDSSAASEPEIRFIASPLSSK